MRLSVCIALTICLISTAWADDFGRPVTGEAKVTFLRAWNERLRDLRTLHMVFKQAKHLRVLRQPLTAEGELWLKGERLLYTLTNVAGDTELVVHLEKQTIRTYYPLLNTLEVFELQTGGALPQPLPFQYADPEVLLRDYAVDLFLDPTGRYTLRLIPRDAKAPLAEIRLVLRDFQPQAMVQVEKNGTRVSMDITSFTANAEFSEAQLALHIPPGTRVVHPFK